MQIIIILAAIGITLTIFFIRAPTILTRFIGQSAIRVTIGILFLFFVNSFVFIDVTDNQVMMYRFR